ncbi:MAG: uridine monophosphate kinase [Candidatus Kerfeldbacteria bacterium]|nr:uridine monophosphate kinase [Candidatus Kerfeldbacteria bacterium]
MAKLAYKRILLKLSGEALGNTGRGLDYKKLNMAVKEIRALTRLGVELGIAIGGGNWWRKRNQSKNFDAVSADYMGMTATVLNALALRQGLAKVGVFSLVQTTIGSEIPLLKPVNEVKARAALKQGRVVIFAGGTGKPFFTTDTAAAQQASLLGAKVLIKAGPADGVYSANPNKHKNAQKFDNLTIKQALRLNLGVMDRQAFAWCEKNKIPIIVCKWQKGMVAKVVRGLAIGTVVKP